MIVRYYTVYHCPRYRIRYRRAEFCGNAFELLESTPDKIAFRVTCYHRMPIDDELAKDEKAVVASYESYDVVMEQEDGQWKFSQFDVPY